MEVMLTNQLICISALGSECARLNYAVMTMILVTIEEAKKMIPLLAFCFAIPVVWFFIHLVNKALCKESVWWNRNHIIVGQFVVGAIILYALVNSPRCLSSLPAGDSP